MHSERFGTLAVAITVAIMFIVVSVVVPMLHSVGTTHKVATGVAGVFGSMALYRGIASLLFAAFRKNLRFRKFILGPAFLEGTWIGFFTREDGHHFTVEFFNQESGETKIIGRQFDSTRKTSARWESEATSVDVDNRRLIYAYSCDIFSANRQQKGLGTFAMIGNGKKSPPNILDGYAADLVDGIKDANKEYKISDELVSDHEALVTAELYRSIGGPLRDGLLVQGPGVRVYLIEKGKRRWIPDENTFYKMNLSRDHVIKISDDALSSIPSGNDCQRL